MSPPRTSMAVSRCLCLDTKENEGELFKNIFYYSIILKIRKWILHICAFVSLVDHFYSSALGRVIFAGSGNQ